MKIKLRQHKEIDLKQFREESLILNTQQYILEKYCVTKG